MYARRCHFVRLLKRNEIMCHILRILSLARLVQNLNFSLLLTRRRIFFLSLSLRTRDIFHLISFHGNTITTRVAINLQIVWRSLPGAQFRRTHAGHWSWIPGPFWIQPRCLIDPTAPEKFIVSLIFSTLRIFHSPSVRSFPLFVRKYNNARYLTAGFYRR